MWDKGTIGLGHWCREQHEDLLIGRRGDFRVPLPENRHSSIIRAPRGRHSEKPDVVAACLEAMYPDLTACHRIELYARQLRPGWTVWGNEVEGQGSKQGVPLARSIA